MTYRSLKCIIASVGVIMLLAGCGDDPSTENTPPNRSELPDLDHPSKTDNAREAAELSADTFAMNTPNNCVNPCSLSTRTTIEIARVAYEADGWALGSSDDASSGFAISYTFNTPGVRTLRAIAFNNDDEMITETQKVVTITPEQPTDESPTDRDASPGHSTAASLREVPYFNQYDNRLYPGATCQNTSVSMVLSYLGWNGSPDDITRRFGKRRAQSPEGLAQVFNSYVSDNDLPKRLKPITNGSLSGLKAELDKGLPVIIHGYFTRSGHVVVVLGYDAAGYYVNDPAGRWKEGFKSGYTGGSGRNVYYRKAPFEAAVGTSNGHSPLALWYHALR